MCIRDSYKAEDYHQDYYKKNPLRYNLYRWNSGRDQFLEGVDWAKGDNMNRMELKKQDMMNEMTYSKPSDEVLRKELTPLQYKVTQEEGTERAFQNEYWDNKEPGIYVDIVSGEPLFSSKETVRLVGPVRPVG